VKQVEEKLGSIIWSYLFKGRKLVGKALREGFFQLALVLLKCKWIFIKDDPKVFQLY